jgi:hypothetical protein
VEWDRGCRRGGVVLPSRITSNHRRSSLVMGSGRPLILLVNQPVTDGCLSSSSMPVPVRMSMTGCAAMPICVRAAMSLVLMAAPGVSCRPARMRRASRASTVRVLLQWWRAACSLAARASTAASAGSLGSGTPPARTRARSRDAGNSTSWRCRSG